MLRRLLAPALAVVLALSLAPLAFAECADPETCCDDGLDQDRDGLTDCDDPDCAGTVACSTETDCNDGEDNDGDGAVDCDDPDCALVPPCDLPEAETDCTNGEDDDGDGAADCDDEDCDEDPACAGEDDCANGEDDDADGLTDCEDTVDCSDDPACIESECSNGEDDDGDGLIDCDDADCAGVGCCAGPEDCDNLRDDDFDGLIDCEDVDRCIDADVCADPPENCADGIDDDGDLLIDCADPECVRDPACPEPPSPAEPPTLTASLEPLACVWPPSHWHVCYELADLGIEVSGECGPFDVLVIDCVSDQPDDGLGDGHTDDDCVFEDGRICVRSERDGREITGRHYEIVAVVVDATGRMSEPTTVGTIFVPHDRTEAEGCDFTPRLGSRTPDLPGFGGGPGGGVGGPGDGDGDPGDGDPGDGDGDDGDGDDGRSLTDRIRPELERRAWNR